MYEVPQGDASPPSGEASAAALAVLVENHRAFLRFLEQRVASREIAEDLLQDAFGKSIERVRALRDSESIVAWFYRLLRNAVIDHYRSGDAARRALDSFARDLDDEVPPPEVYDAICACVSRLARTLKPEYADALQQIEVESVAVKDFADRVGITPNNAAVRVFRAREALRQQVLASCGTCADHGCLDCACGRPHRKDGHGSR